MFARGSGRSRHSRQLVNLHSSLDRRRSPAHTSQRASYGGPRSTTCKEERSCDSNTLQQRRSRGAEVYNSSEDPRPRHHTQRRDVSRTRGSFRPNRYRSHALSIERSHIFPDNPCPPKPPDAPITSLMAFRTDHTTTHRRFYWHAHVVFMLSVVGGTPRPKEGPASYTGPSKPDRLSGRGQTSMEPDRTRRRYGI